MTPRQKGHPMDAPICDRRLLEAVRADKQRRKLSRLEGAIREAVGDSPPIPRTTPTQEPEKLYVPDLAASAWHDSPAFEDAAILESSAQVIRQELRQLLERREGFQPFDEGPGGFNPYNTDFGWNVFYFRWGFTDLPENHALCPQTSAVLRSLPNLAQTALFSGLAPGMHLVPHCGPTNVVLTLHLGLVVPADCEMRVGRETRHWQEGKCLVFDDSFEHEVWQRGPHTRFVLLLDVWHPDLTSVERRFLAQHLWSPEQVRLSTEQHRTALRGKTWWQ